MKAALFLVVILLSVITVGQSSEELMAEVKSFQVDQNEHYFNKETSPLPNKERRKFKGHNFYAIDLDYALNAQFKRIENPDTIVMSTSAGTEKMFARYATISFQLNGEQCALTAYQNLKVIKMEGYENSLFIPFKDETSGTETYGGGRYLDLEMPEGDEIFLNFNLAYNPYCAYTTGWFCPLPPDENTLKVAVRVGLMSPQEH